MMDAYHVAVLIVAGVVGIVCAWWSMRPSKEER